MQQSLICWDLETIPDLAAVARVHGLAEGDDASAREILGDKFPRLPFHQVVCIGALVAERDESGVFRAISVGAPHTGERPEGELIQAFVDKIAERRPQLVTFNGSSFDLPVLRYRAMTNRVSAPGLECRKYFYRYSDDCLDLCDALACFSPGGKFNLNDLCRVLQLPGKPDGIDGSEVERYVQEGRLSEVAQYCETDVINTYRVFLIYELFRGALTRAQFDASEAQLLEFIRERVGVRPYLGYLLGEQQPITLPISENTESSAIMAALRGTGI